MPQNNEVIWEKCLEEIRARINRQSFTTWFEETRGLPAEGDNLVILVKNQFTADWLEQHHIDLVFSVINEVAGNDYKLTLAVPTHDGSFSYSVASPRERKKTENQDSDDHQLNPKYTFDSFVVGDFNRFAHAAALAVAEAPGKNKYSPLYIYGGTGLGKTHLLQAIGHFIREENPTAKVIYVTSERFTNEFIESLKSKTSAEFNRVYRNVDVLLIDDVQFFGGKEAIQSEFFHIFNSLYQKGKQIVLISDVAPPNIAGLQERLISRMKWGLVVDIRPPDLEGRIAILKRKAEFDGLSLDPDVLVYIAENVTSNVRDLEGTLIRLLAYSSISRREITIDMARDVLVHYQSFSDRRCLRTPDICRGVADAFGVSESSLQNKRRTQPLALARQVAMYLCRELTDNSLKTIGLYFGGRDHSTVVHAIKSVKSRLRADNALAEKIASIKVNLR